MDDQASAPQIVCTRIQARRTRAIGLQYVALGFVLFNLIYGGVMFLASPRFSYLVREFLPFWIIYMIALFLALLALKDKKSILLYPLLAATLLIIFVCSSLWFYDVTNVIYCAWINSDEYQNVSSTDSVYMALGYQPEDDAERLIEGFLSCPPKTTSYSDYMQTFILPSALFALLFFVICMEKFIELLIFYRLVKIFRVMSDERRNFGTSDALPGCSYIVPRTPPVCEKNPGESDDDMVVFERVNRQLQFKENARVRDYAANGNGQYPKPPAPRSRPSFPISNSKRVIA
ncbi:hypothetical protein Ddc_02980 [Ditylenchus destructor]|nr:hypothetical protein Ddc_02980 [Ditylenchus destructor]